MASQLRDEVLANFGKFEQQWPQELIDSITRIAGAKKHFEDSFIRISVVQAWRSSVVVNLLDEDSEAFFFEGQNDFLVSHCLARCGSFRQSLKAIRGAIENVYFSLYYKDHPIEFRKWESGRHKLGFSEMHKYFEAHPDVQGSLLAKQALELLEGEYATLSQAVHGSAKAFRMTQNLTELRLWSDDLPTVGKWAAREKRVISSLNMLFLHIFREQLTSAQNRNLREAVGLIVPQANHAAIKAALGVTLIS